MKKVNFRGFTLIELLIVITIIGILAAALLPSVLGAPAKARDAARKADLNNIVAAVEVYNSENGAYPTGADCIDNITGLDKYFQGGTAPTDPSNKGPSLTGTCANNYYYCKLPAAASPQNYMLVSFAEDAGKADADATATEITGCASVSAPITSYDQTPDTDPVFTVIE